VPRKAENHYTNPKLQVSEWTAFTSFISSLELRTTVVDKFAVTGPNSSRVYLPAHRSTLTHSYKHDTPSSHFKVTLGQPALI